MNRTERRRKIMEAVWSYYYSGRATSRDLLRMDESLKAENFSTLSREIRHLIEENRLKRVPGRKGYFIPAEKTLDNPSSLNAFIKKGDSHEDT